MKIQTTKKKKNISKNDAHKKVILNDMLIVSAVNMMSHLLTHIQTYARALIISSTALHSALIHRFEWLWRFSNTLRKIKPVPVSTCIISSHIIISLFYLYKLHLLSATFVLNLSKLCFLSVFRWSSSRRFQTNTYNFYADGFTYFWFWLLTPK